MKKYKAENDGKDKRQFLTLRLTANEEMRTLGRRFGDSPDDPNIR